jgi:hypothetical protein
MSKPYRMFESGPRKGQPKTLTDRVVRYLVEGMGMVERTSRSKYRWFASAEYGNLFVGSTGAVRAGTIASNSVSVTDAIHARMKLWEKEREA